MFSFDKEIYGNPAYAGNLPGTNLKAFIYSSKEEASQIGANRIIYYAKQAAIRKEKCGIVIPTGNSPLLTYEKLVKEYEGNNEIFKNIDFFSMDEYRHPAKKYYTYQQNNFIGKIECGAYYIMDAKTSNSNTECLEFQKKIDTTQIVFVLGGSGVEGHVAFNEGNSFLEVCAHEEILSDSTKKANKFDFMNEDFPDTAFTMGMGTMFRGEAVFYLFGEAKREPIIKLAEGKITTKCPLTFLLLHQNAALFLDEAAGMPLIETGIVKPC